MNDHYPLLFMRNKYFWPVLVVAIISSACSSNYQTKSYREPVNVIHRIEDISSLEMMWVRSDVYIGPSPSYTSLATSLDTVFIDGSLDNYGSGGVVAMENSTGNFLWKTDLKSPSTLLANHKGLFVGESGGGGRITMYDPSTGIVKWSKFFWNSSGVEHLLVFNNELHIYLAPNKHRILRISNGKTIYSVFPQQPPYFDSSVCGDVYQTPIYTTKIIYYRIGNGLDIGEVCAVNFQTGRILWISDLDIISNVSATEEAVFVILESGELVTLDPKTGEKISDLSVSFDNTPFIHYSARMEVGNYYVTYNSDKIFY